MKQATFASLAVDREDIQARRERFPAEMDAVIPSALLVVNERYYPNAGWRGRPPMPIETMLRVCFMQKWCAMSDSAMGDALYEIE